MTERVQAAAAHVASTAPKMGPLAGRRLGSRGIWAATATTVLFFVARLTLEVAGLPTAARIAIALLPLPAFLWLLREFVRVITDSDELEQRVQLEALAVAFPLTLVLVMTLGLLQIAIALPLDDWSYRHIWPLLYVFYLFGILRARRRYQ